MGWKMLKQSFSMEKILDWRMSLEDQARLRLNELEGKWQFENQNLQSYIRENVKIKNANMETLHITTLQYNDYYKVLLDEKIVKQKNYLDKIQIDIKQAQGNLLKAHTDRKAMEKLKEKELFRVTAEEQRLEQLALDEFATMNYKRKAL